MKIQIESTTKVIEMRTPDGSLVPARIWEGHTESGIPVHCYITRIACHESADQEQFKRELTETRVPSPEIAAIPMRFIL